MAFKVATEEDYDDYSEWADALSYFLWSKMESGEECTRQTFYSWIKEFTKEIELHG